MKRLAALGIFLICCCHAQGQSSGGDAAFRTLTIGINYRPLKLTGLNQLLDLGAFPAINSEWTMLSISREIEPANAPDWSGRLNISLGYQSKRKEEPRSVEATLVQVSVGFGVRVWKNDRVSLITQTGLDMMTLNVRCYDKLIDTTNVTAYISAPQSDIRKVTCSQPCLRTGLMLRWIGKEGTAFKVSSGYNIPLQAATISHYRGGFGDVSATRLGGFQICAEFGFAWQRCMD
jgi:hypothetical protein